MNTPTNLYLILGTPNSGRKEILFDLIEASSKPENSNTLILLPSDDPQTPATLKLQTLPNTHILEWNFSNNQLLLPNFNHLLSTPNDNIFLILSTHANLIDQIEQIKLYLDAHPKLSLARILSVINCQLLYQNEPLLPWFQAAIHFSDYIWITHHENIPQKWLSDFLNSFEKQSFPCLFEKIKNFKVANPNQALEPQARRISLLFDNLDPLDTMDFDENHLPEEPFNLIKEQDPYLKRDDDGNRIIQLPSISDYF